MVNYALRKVKMDMASGQKDKRTIDETLLIPILEDGKRLYHYTSAAGLQGICSGEFWVTERSFLNDIMEFQVAIQIFCEVIDRHMSNKTRAEKLKKKVCDEIDRLNTPGMLGEEVAYSGDYVISFSLDNDSILMWSEYSDFYGYCMEFDGEELIETFQSNDSYCFLHGQVVYDHDEQVKIIEKTLEMEILNHEPGFEYLNSWSDLDDLTNENIEDLYLWIAVIINAYNVFFKLECFKGENEYRFVFMSIHDGGRVKENEREKQYFRIKNEVLTPYIKKKFPRLNSLKSVMIGPKNKSDIAEKGLRYFFRNMKLEVDVYKSKMPIRY